MIRPASAGGDDGFVLIEALAALAILAMLTGALLANLSTAQRARNQAELDQRALTIARDQLSLVLVGIRRSQPRMASGMTSDGYVWTVTERPYASGQAGDRNLLEIRVAAEFRGTDAAPVSNQAVLVTIVTLPAGPDP